MPGDDPALLPEWDFQLPDEQIARQPAVSRSGSRLLRLPRVDGPLSDHPFQDLPRLLRPGDLLVANDSRVMPARLRAARSTGGSVELMCLECGPGPIRALARPARRLKVGEELVLRGGGVARLVGVEPEGVVVVELEGDPLAVMEAQGEVPLPPYLGRAEQPEDRERYQTVYARSPGSAAAPTAGLHFDPPLLEALATAGIGFCTVTLHVGLGTFRPLRAEDLERGELHAERYEVPASTSEAIARTRASGGRVIAVGTTTARTLESATQPGTRTPAPGSGVTRLFVRPGWEFRCIDGLVTNFHLPGSSLLLLVGALVGRERLLAAYARAIRDGYRFYSYGDAMLVL